MDNNKEKRQKLVVLGGGESGVGAAILGKDKLPPSASPWRS